MSIALSLCQYVLRPRRGLAPRLHVLVHDCSNIGPELPTSFFDPTTIPYAAPFCGSGGGVLLDSPPLLFLSGYKPRTLGLYDQFLT